MFEEGSKLLLANGQARDIAEIKPGTLLLCADGSISKVITTSKDVQVTYQILQKTKHRANEGEAGRKDPLRRHVYHRLGFRCTVAHEILLRTASKPLLENSYKRNTYRVKWKNMEDILTIDGRIINIPKTHHKDFPMTIEGKFEASKFMMEKEEESGIYLEYSVQVRDLDLLESQIRSNSFLRFSPVITGNGILSEFLTGQKHLTTPFVLDMAWLLGLWLGDGTTKEPEITVDSHDITLMDGLIERCKMWGIYPDYKDEPIPLRAKHVKLYFGSSADENRKTRNLRKNNPFWNTVLGLGFKRILDGEKQIPIFMWNEDLEVREAFLAGLIDSDGYVIKKKEGFGAHKVAIQTIYPSLMNGIAHISRSLGLAVTITTRSARSEIIEGRKVNCHFTYDCNIAGRTPLQNVLVYCRSGHKWRPKPNEIARDPVYFGFTEEKRGQKNVFSVQTDSGKPIMLDNKVVVKTCGNHCNKEQPKLTSTRYLKYCVACPKKGVRYFYRDWTGKSRLCGRCYGRYKFSGYRCLKCNYVPEAREIRNAKVHGEKHRLSSHDDIISRLKCGRCAGYLKYDAVRGPKKVIETFIAPIGLVSMVEG